MGARNDYYKQASNTVHICEQGKNMLQKSKHLTITCETAREQMGRIPIIFAMEFTLRKLFENTVLMLCQVGASWLSTIITSSMLTLVLAYLYQKMSASPNIYAMMLASQYENNQRSRNTFLHCFENSCLSEVKHDHPLSLTSREIHDKNIPSDYSIFTYATKNKLTKEE